MKAKYRNCEIQAHRDQALGGWSEVYWSACAADGYILADGFGNYGNVREAFAGMKRVVDRFLDECKGVISCFEGEQDT